ncbi:MAG: sulfide/dihydroorotate dehydrogenase-like FAD/NAD-binding protein [Candidatus Heimdallarchaeota archaeon]|nr:sulfide/dihydroorotate dehydrogenase-like FAD/NAD-binding protein [Candidatus Heimdallarchaeota archaeon]
MPFEIVRSEKLHETIFLLEVKAPRIAAKAKAGNFIILRAHEKGERIPITIADSNKEAGTIVLVIQIVGKTSALLSTYKKGDTLQDLVGPLGRATNVKKYGTIAIVAGGVGIPLAHPVAQAFKKAGNHVISIIGARTKELLIWEDKMKKASSEVKVSTDDGSYGFKGFTTQLLEKTIEEQKLKNNPIDFVFTVGPAIMMKFITKVTEKYNIPTEASLNSIMVDGTGMCGACRVTVGGETKFACVDGPEFNAHRVDWDELMTRLSQYKQQEVEAYDLYKKKREKGHNCQCGGR